MARVRRPGQKKGVSRDFPYDSRRTPPAPVLPLRVGTPGVEPSVAVPALIDSGADITVLPHTLVASLNLPQVGYLTVQGVGGMTQRALVYAAEIEVRGLRRIVEVVGMGGETLLGRDVLNLWVVTLDGPRRVLRVEQVL